VASFAFISLVAVSWGAYDAVSLLKEKSASLVNEMEGEKKQWPAN
jgi:hypothetical protein